MELSGHESLGKLASDESKPLEAFCTELLKLFPQMVTNGTSVRM